MTQTITQAELRNGSAGVMDALEGGENFIVTRNGTPVGELIPIQRRNDLTANQVIQLFRGLPRGSSYEEMRAESDALFGEDRIDG